MNSNPNPTLTDIFETVLSKTSVEAPMRAPNITVNGNGNVLAWGGTVNLKQAAISGAHQTNPQELVQ